MKTIIGLLILLAVFTVCSMCVVSGRASEAERKAEAKRRGMK